MSLFIFWVWSCLQKMRNITPKIKIPVTIRNNQKQLSLCDDVTDIEICWLNSHTQKKLLVRLTQQGSSYLILYVPISAKKHSKIDSFIFHPTICSSPCDDIKNLLSCRQLSSCICMSWVYAQPLLSLPIVLGSRLMGSNSIFDWPSMRSLFWQMLIQSIVEQPLKYRMRQALWLMREYYATAVQPTLDNATNKLFLWRSSSLQSTDYLKLSYILFVYVKFG